MHLIILIVLIVLIVLITLTVLTALNALTASNKRVSEITGAGASNSKSCMEKYKNLFCITKDEYINASVTMSTLIRSVIDGKDIGLTKKQKDLITNYRTAFNKNATNAPYIDSDDRRFNGIIFSAFDISKIKTVLSVGTYNLGSYKNKKLDCDIHDAMLLAGDPDGEQLDHNIRTINANKFDNIYGHYSAKDKLENINEMDKIKSKYDMVVYRYRMDDIQFKSTGPLLLNGDFHYTIISTNKALQKLKNGGRLVFVINFVFMFPAVKKFILKLASAFKSYKIELVKFIIMIQFEEYSEITLNTNMKYEDIDNLYYSSAGTSINCVYDTDEVEVAGTIHNELDSYLFAHYNSINSKHYIKPDFDAIIINDIYESIRVSKLSGLGYNEYFVSSVTEYYRKVFLSIIAINSTVMSVIVKYDSDIKIKVNLPTYFYEDKLGVKLLCFGKIDYSSLDKENKRMLSIYEDFTRGVSKYLSDNYKITGLNKVSNAFVKLWEIYHQFGIITDNTNAFHMCEAPGQWIKTTEYYINKHNKADYIWHANSLNPDNEENKKIFGDHIIDDTYGLMKRYKDKWLFGSDNTGDITKSSNILEYRNNKLLKNINLVTGDAGLPPSMDLVYLQKLDYSQALITVATCGMGGNCVIKCFTPYMKTKPKSLESTGFFINLLYLYYCYFSKLYLYKPYSSSPFSGEFYIVGKDFTGISDSDLNKLLKVQDNFEENQVFIEKEDIPENFVAQIYNFLEHLIDLNVATLEKQKFMHSCANDKDDIIQFKQLIEPSQMEKVRESRFKSWIDMFQFT